MTKREKFARVLEFQQKQKNQKIFMDEKFPGNNQPPSDSFAGYNVKKQDSGLLVAGDLSAEASEVPTEHLELPPTPEPPVPPEGIGALPTSAVSEADTQKLLERDPRFTEEVVDALKGKAYLSSDGDPDKAEEVDITDYLGTSSEPSEQYATLTTIPQHVMSYRDQEGTLKSDSLDKFVGWGKRPEEQLQQLEAVGLNPPGLSALSHPIFTPITEGAPIAETSEQGGLLRNAPVSVKRSSGEIESGWQVGGYEQDPEKGLIVRVIKPPANEGEKGTEKWVLASELAQWQPSPEEKNQDPLDNLDSDTEPPTTEDQEGAQTPEEAESFTHPTYLEYGRDMMKQPDGSFKGGKAKVEQLYTTEGDVMRWADNPEAMRDGRQIIMHAKDGQGGHVVRYIKGNKIYEIDMSRSSKTSTATPEPKLIGVRELEPDEKLKDLIIGQDIGGGMKLKSVEINTAEDFHISGQQHDGNVPVSARMMFDAKGRRKLHLDSSRPEFRKTTSLQTLQHQRETAETRLKRYIAAQQREDNEENKKRIEAARHDLERLSDNSLAFDPFRHMDDLVGRLEQQGATSSGYEPDWIFAKDGPGYHEQPTEELESGVYDWQNEPDLASEWASTQPGREEELEVPAFVTANDIAFRALADYRKWQAEHTVSAQAKRAFSRGLDRVHQGNMQVDAAVRNKMDEAAVKAEEFKENWDGNLDELLSQPPNSTKEAAIKDYINWQRDQAEQNRPKAIAKRAARKTAVAAAKLRRRNR